MKTELMQASATITAALIASNPDHQDIGLLKDLFLKVYEQVALAEKEYLSKPRASLSILPEALAKASGHGAR